MDISSETVHGLLPVYLVAALGANATAVGILEGFAEAFVLVFKVLSGPISDLLSKRKPIVVLGYSMGALSKPLFAISNSISFIYVARIFDRIGKGIRGAPRDAMVADLAPANLRGRAFGLRQSLDTIGAFLGPTLAIVLMKTLNGDFKIVFWIATIPGMISVIILLRWVKEEPKREAQYQSRHLNFREIKMFQRNFWIVSAAGAIFQLARFSEAFLILKIKDLGVSSELAPVVLIIMNVVYALSAYPIGFLSDRIPRKLFLMIGMLILCIADLLLALTHEIWLSMIGIALWGLHLGFTQGTLAALVADTCPQDRKGTAYGIFNIFSAISLLIASVLAGFIWDHFAPQVTFYAGSGISFLSFLVFIFIKKMA